MSFLTVQLERSCVWKRERERESVCVCVCVWCVCVCVSPLSFSFSFFLSPPPHPPFHLVWNAFTPPDTFTNRWPLRTSWPSQKELTPWTASGRTPTAASTAGRTAATCSTRCAAACASPWSGAVSSPTSPSGTSGTSRLASRCWSSTVPASRSCTACVSTAAWIPAARRAVWSSTRSRRTERACSCVGLGFCGGCGV